MIEGTGSESAVTWASSGSTCERDPDDDDAVVVGAGERRGDRDHRERRPLVRTGEVHPPDRVEGVAAGAGGDVVAADFRGGRAAREGLLEPAGARRGGGDRGLRAVGDPAQRADQAGRHHEAEFAEVLVAVFAVEFQGEAGERARPASCWSRPRASARRAAPAAGQAPPPGPESTLIPNFEFWSACAGFQGKRCGGDRVDRAVDRRREHAAVGGEDVHLELFQRQLRQVEELGAQLPGGRVGDQLADQLHVQAEAVREQEQPVLFARQRFAEVDRAFGSGPGIDSELSDDGADLGVVGAVRRSLRWPKPACGVRAGALAVGRVGVDRQAFGEDQFRRPSAPKARRRGSAPAGSSNSRSSPEAESASLGGQPGLGDRAEGLPFAFGDRRIGGGGRDQLRRAVGRSRLRARSAAGRRRSRRCR